MKKITKEPIDQICARDISEEGGGLIAGITVTGRIVVLTRDGSYDTPGSWRAQIFGGRALKTLNGYTKNDYPNYTMADFLNATSNHIEWIVFESPREFFEWALKK